MKKINIGIIGTGKMGRLYINELKDNPRWNIKYLCGHNEEQLAEIHNIIPWAEKTQSSEIIFNDQSINVVGVFTYADSRYEYIKRARLLVKI